MAIHDHIKYLLYRHNCVVLPGFGGIVLQYAPARIHPAQHIFQPPRKALAFNRSLTTNDGLLITHLANAEQLHYDDAENIVRRYVEQIENSIRRKGDFVMPGVGRFHNDIESNLQFEPEEFENYLLNAYGLDRFVSPAIVRRDAFEPSTTPAEAFKRKRRFNWFGLSIIILLTMFLSIQILSVQNMSDILPNPVAGFHLFDSTFDSNQAIKTPKTINSDSSHGKRDTVVQIIVIKDESKAANIDSVSFSSTGTNVSVVPETVEPHQPIENTLVNPEPVAPVKTIPHTDLSYTDSIKLIQNSKVPMRGEYDPSTTGNFVIVFSNSFDSTKASYFKQQLWKDRIGAQVLPFHKRLLVAKPGYFTSHAAAKDLYIYRMLGYEDAYILKMKKE